MPLPVRSGPPESRRTASFCFPQRSYHRPCGSPRRYAQLTRFLPREARALFDERTAAPEPEATGTAVAEPAPTPTTTVADVRARLRDLWS